MGGRTKRTTGLWVVGTVGVYAIFFRLKIAGVYQIAWWR